MLFVKLNSHELEKYQAPNSANISAICPLTTTIHIPLNSFYINNKETEQT